MGSEGDAKDDESGRPRAEFGPPVSDFGPPVGGFGPPLKDSGPPTGDFGPPVGDFGPPVGGFGPPLKDSGPPTGDFGPPVGGFGPPLRDSGPPTGDFGPPVSDFGGPPLAESGPKWTVPQPPGDHPELGWRPAADVSAPPPDARYRAPDSTELQAPAPAASQPEFDPEATTRHQSPAPVSDRDRWWNPTDTGDVPKPPAESARRESGLSWADDPIAKRLAPGAPAAETGGSGGSGASGRWVVLGVAGALAVLIGLVVTIVAMSRGSGDDEAAVAVSPSTTTAALSCPASRDGKVSVGNGPGDTSSGPSAILGFQYAFYVERSGERVRHFVAPDAENISTADVIQGAITEQIPAGTTHCLRITERATDTYEVDLTEHRPDGTTTVYRQTVITVERDGKTSIFAIRERG
ncbi:hypothetical protein [Nocardia sp. NPDC005366]|uniref:hypothetical protein n=1 Tax=Nocardia sp. NPDC005366 TaxID=3156878 RepID=UPI0033B5FDC5